MKAAFIAAFVAFVLGRSNQVGRFQMFQGKNSIAISQNGVTKYEKEDSIFLINTVTGEVRKYAHDTITLGGQTTVYEGWGSILQPIGDIKK